MNKERPYFLRLLNIRMFPMDLGRFLIGPFVLLAYRPKVVFVGENAKKSLHYKHGAILTSNHISLHDPFIVGTAFWRRRMFFLVGEFVMDYPIRGFLLRRAGCIRVDRKIADIEAMRKTVSLLEQGSLITIFAEGGIHHGKGPGPFKNGPIMMAQEANVPIIPCYFEKRKHWWNRYRVAVGELFDPRDELGDKAPSIAEIRACTEKLWEKTKQLEEALRK